jgi:hypothetical protein
MTVKWTEQISAYQLEMIWNWYPDANGFDFDSHYEGEIIGTNQSFWYGSTLTVMCTDGKVRTINSELVKQQK